MFILFFLCINILFSNISVENIEVRSFSASEFDSFDPLFMDDYFSNIKRGKMDIDSEWIAVEKDYDSIYVYDAFNPENKFEFFKKGVRNKKNNYYADNVTWSPSEYNIFYFRHYDLKEKVWSFESAEFDPDDSKSPFLIKKKYPTPYGSDYISDLKINYIHLADYKNDFNEDVYYLIISNNLNLSKNTMIVTNFYDQIWPNGSDLWSIYDSNDEAPQRNFYSKISNDDKLLFPREIQTTNKHFPINGETNEFLQSVITFKSNQLFQENDIYYYCDMRNKKSFSGDSGYQVFPRNDSYYKDQQYYPFCNQFSPKFNFDGTKIAFLNQVANPSGEDICSPDAKLIDLWVFDLSTSFNQMCLDNSAYTYDGDFDGAYTLISKKVLNLFAMDESELSEASDFVWHPNQDIIFYIDNSNANDKGELKNDIYYYNFSTGENKILKTGTEYNRYISISDDGDYLIFSFRYSDDDNSYVDGECTNCSNPYFYKTAIAKINIDE